MEKTKESKEPTYDVVQFMELPYENIDKYIIIPHSWIKIILAPEGSVFVPYPTKNSSKTYKRIINNEDYKMKWKRYKAVVKYEASTFEEARYWISVATFGSSNMNESAKQTEMDHDGNCSDADNLVEDDNDDEDCVILIKEEPIDIYVTQMNEGYVDSGTASMTDDEQLDLNENFSGAENSIAPSNYNLEDNVTSPIIDGEQMDHNESFSGAENLIAPSNDDLVNNVTSPIIDDEQMDYNDYCADSDEFVPQTNTDGADTGIAHTDKGDTDEDTAPINNNDPNKHAATSNNNCTDNFVPNLEHNNDTIKVGGNSTNDFVVPINNTDIDNGAAVDNCVEDYIPFVHNNEAVHYITPERNNNTDDCVPSGCNDNANNCVAPNNCTDNEVAPNNCNYQSHYIAPSKYSATGDCVAPINNNEAASINYGSGSNHVGPKNNDENIDRNETSQNVLNDVASNFIQTGRPRSVTISIPSKSLAAQKKTYNTTFCDCPPTFTFDKPRMTVMPLINKQNESAASKSVIGYTKKQQRINNDKKITERDYLNHLIELNINSKEKQTYPIPQDISDQPLGLDKNGTSNVNNAFHKQVYPQDLSNSANMSFISSKHRNLFQKHTSRVSVNYFTTNVSPFAESTSKMPYLNSNKDNMASANENLHRTQPEPSRHDYNNLPVTLHENYPRAESVTSNIAHYTVSQMNHNDQTAYSQNANNTAPIQRLTEYPTNSNTNSGQQMTSANGNFALAKPKFSLASVQQSELSCHHYALNSLPVTLHEKHLSVESNREEVNDHRVNQLNRIDDKAYSSNVKNNALTEYPKHGKFNSGQQMRSANDILCHANEPTEYSTHNTVRSTITTQEPLQSNNPLPRYCKKTQRTSPKQSQQKSSDYTFRVQPAQTIISDSTNQVPTSENVVNNQTFPVQNSFSAALQHWILPTFQRHMPNDPRATQIPVRKPMESNSTYFQYDYQQNMRGKPLVLQNAGLPNDNSQVRQLIRPVNYLRNLLAHNTPTVFPNSLQAPHTQRMPTAISTIADNMYRGSPLEEYMNTGAPGVPNFANRAVPFSDHTSIDKDHVVQDTNRLIFGKPPNAYPYDQRTSGQSSSMSTPLGVQQYPAANQLNQCSGHFNERQTVETHMQNVNTERQTAVNARSFNPQLYDQHLQHSQNMESLAHNPPIQTNQYHYRNKCCNPNAVMSSVVHNYSHQKQNQNPLFSTGNSLNSTNQSSEYVKENQLAVQQQNFSSKIAGKQHKYSKWSDCGTNQTEMYQSLINQAEAYIEKEPITPIPVDSSDEEMSTEYNIIEYSNTTKECLPEKSKNRQYYEKSGRPLLTSLNSLDEEISIKKNTDEKTNNAKDNNDKICLPDNCAQHSRVQNRQTSLKEIETHLEKMVSMSYESYLKQTKFDSCSGDIDILLWNKVKEGVIAYVDRKINKSSSEVKLQFHNKNKEKNNVQNVNLDNDQSSGDDNDDDDDDYHEPPQKKAFYRKRTSEYNPNDTKWTLKHQKPSPELTELIPESNIFVSSVALAACKRNANDYKTLARMLFTEVFDETALKICSLTGVRATKFTGPKSEVKPGLNARAIQTIITYVKTYGEMKGWGLFDKQSVKNTMRSKLNLYRRSRSASSSSLRS